VTGKVSLNLNKVVEMINYLAENVPDLHKVKLMKMLWYADSLHFKRNDVAISGLAYSTLPMGAVPEGHDQIIKLDGVNFDTIFYKENMGYKFKVVSGFVINELEKSEIDALDTIIFEVSNLGTKEIIKRMHAEEAYGCTDSNRFISYTFAKNLTIN